MRNDPDKMKTSYMRFFKGDKAKEGQPKDFPKKGLPNETNYISECYPTLPAGENSASIYQKMMKDKMNLQKRSMNISNSATKYYQACVEGSNDAKSKNKRIIKVGLQKRYDTNMTDLAKNGEHIDKARNRTHKRHHGQRGNTEFDHQRHNSEVRTNLKKNDSNFGIFTCFEYRLKA